MAGAVLLVLGAAAMGPTGRGLLVLGFVALVLAGVAGLGGRGAKECQAYQRSGMAAIDTMNGRQFQFLLEHLFAKKGYRVARLRVRGDSGADLLLDLPRGRTMVQVEHWSSDVVRHEAVHQAVVAKAHYGVARALVVTSSNYSADAVAVANSNGVMLWNRAALAAELSAFRCDSLPSGPKRFSADLRAGSLITLGYLATLQVALVAAGARARSRVAATRRVVTSVHHPETVTPRLCCGRQARGDASTNGPDLGDADGDETTSHDPPFVAGSLRMETWLAAHWASTENVARRFSRRRLRSCATG